jgi:2,3-dihydroxy-2,3-dihydrophenylpropionate dehydrogenase
MEWLKDKVALVTGGGSGIGRAVVDAYRQAGAHVVVLEIHPDKVAALAQDLGGSGVAVQGDATRLEDNRRAVNEATGRFGRLDVLTCCVGVWDFMAALQAIPDDRFDDAFNEIFAINVKSCFASTKAAAPALIASEGAIVYTLSNSAFYPDGGGPLYIASKHAVRGLVTQMAFELAPKVRVNGVAPGGTLTTLGGLRSLDQGGRLSDIPGIEDLMRHGNPLQKVFRPEDHAGAYLYLASSELSSGVTGVIINSDGGLGVRGIGRLAGLLENPGTA